MNQDEDQYVRDITSLAYLLGAVVACIGIIILITKYC